MILIKEIKKQKLSLMKGVRCYWFKIC